MAKVLSRCYQFIKALERRVAPHFFNGGDAIIRKAKRHQQTRFLIYWNRGLGDIALALVAFCHRIRCKIPHAEITFVTRPDLKEIFALLDHVSVISDPCLKRGDGITHMPQALKKQGYTVADFDVVLDRVSGRWIRSMIGRYTPKLHWQTQWDALARPFDLNGHDYIGLHIDSETGQFYCYDKNWPTKNWQELIAILTEKHNKQVILFGLSKKSSFNHPNVVDLRGKTNYLELLAIIKNHCDVLVAPDSGILSTVYYLNCPFELKIISLWGEQNNTGVRELKVSSPNPNLTHIEILGTPHINTITTQRVLQEVL